MKHTFSTHLIRAFMRKPHAKSEQQTIPDHTEHLAAEDRALEHAIAARQKHEQARPEASRVTRGGGNHLEAGPFEREPRSRHVPRMGDEINPPNARGTEDCTAQARVLERID